MTAPTPHATPQAARRARRTRRAAERGARKLGASPRARTGGRDTGGTGEPPSTLFAPFARADAFAAALGVLGPLLLYVLTLPRDVVLEDDGLFLMVGHSLGVAHPPGYPLYTWISHAFMRLHDLPFTGSLSPAFFGHLSSAVLGALACAAVYACARLLQPSKLAALAAAWLFGASEHFWSQAIIAEVYTLNALLFFVVYAALLRGSRAPDTHAAWWVAAIAYGLSLANHWPLMGLATPALLLALAPLWRSPALPRLLRRAPVLIASSLASAAIPYAWMVWRSQQHPLISFYGAIPNWDSFWFYVSRQGYAEVDVSPSAGWGDRLALLEWFGGEVLWQLTLPGCALAVLGLFVLWRSGRRSEAVSSAVAFGSQSVLLIALLSFDFDFLQVAVFRPYSLVCYGLLALWLAVGLWHSARWCAERLPESRAHTALRIGALKIGTPQTVTRAALIALAGLAMSAWSVQASWRANDRADSDFARAQTDAIFAALPKNAILLVYGDADTSVIGYRHLVANRRPDIALYNMQGLAFRNRLFPALGSSGRKQPAYDKLIARAQREGRAVFYTTPRETLTEGRVARHHGFIQEVLPDGVPGTVQLKFNAAASQVFRRLLASEYEHPWERDHQSSMLAYYGRYLGLYVLSGNAEAMRPVEPLLARAEQNLPCLVGMMESLMSNWQPQHTAQLTRWMALSDALLDDIPLTKSSKAQYFYMKGYLQHLLKDEAGAIHWFQKSRALYDHPKNESINALRKLNAL